MRGLAEYVMKGRRQATIAAFLAALIPVVNLLSPAIVGLVCLRHGLREALSVMVWAVLPLIGWAMIGDITPGILMLSVLALATVLRGSHSWQMTLLAAVLVGVAAEMMLRLRPEFLAQIMQQLEMAMSQGGSPEELDQVSQDELRNLLLSLFGLVHMFMSVCLVMLSRWWQALLFNPGGFGQEFHRFRLEPSVGMLLAVLFLAASFGVPVLSGWVMYFVTPLFFAGLALVHGVVARKQLSRLWLVVFYVLLLNPLVTQLLTVAALVDSWYDFRARLNTV